MQSPDKAQRHFLMTTPVSVFKLNPLQDPRWQDLVDRHPYGSVFHSTVWLDALSRTYGYEPVVYTTSSPASKLSNGIVFSRVRSWVSGSRLVSLPFSDHCEPLATPEEMSELMHSLMASRRLTRWKYIEIRPLRPDAAANTRDLTRSESDRKSTRLNSSHQIISYAVFSLKKKKSLYI